MRYLGYGFLAASECVLTSGGFLFCIFGTSPFGGTAIANDTTGTINIF